MPSDPNPPGGSGAEYRPVPSPAGPPSQPVFPQSRVLQVFLVVALLVSVAAFVADRWTAATTRRMELTQQIAQKQSPFLKHVRDGDEAFAKKRFAQAVSEYTLALREKSQAELQEKLGRAFLQEGNPDQAFAQFKEALQIEPGRIETYTAWGEGLLAQGKAEEAARLYQQALSANPKSGLLHYHLAAALRQQEKQAEAARRAAVSSGNTAEAKTADEESQRLAQQALEQYSAANQLGVNLPAFWCGYGELLNEQGKFAEAEACLLQAVSKDSSMARAYSALAQAEVPQGKYAGAIGHYEAVLRLAPDDPATLNSLALLYATATNSEVFSPKMAVLLALRACEATARQNARYMDTLARGYAAAGDFLQAISWEDKAAHRATQLGDRDLAADLEARYGRFLDHKAD